MNDSYLIFPLANYAAKLVEKETSPKYYFMDTGLVGLMLLDCKSAQLEKSTSVNVRKLGTLKELLIDHGPTRDDVMRWAKEEARLETLKYKKEQQIKAVPVTFHSNQKLDYDQQVLYRGGYLFPQAFYYRLQLDKTCRKLREKYTFKYDINAILSDLVYARVLEPASKLTDALHNVCGFETDYKFITKRQMKKIQKRSKGRE